MKKTAIVAMAIVLVSTLGTAFAADSAPVSGRSGGLYNGITYFDLGPSAACDSPVTASAMGSAVKPYNGVTIFDLGQQGSGAKGSCANRVSSNLLAGRPVYNGITIF